MMVSCLVGATSALHYLPGSLPLLLSVIIIIRSRNLPFFSILINYSWQVKTKVKEIKKETRAYLSAERESGNEGGRVLWEEQLLLVAFVSDLIEQVESHETGHPKGIAAALLHHLEKSFDIKSQAPFTALRLLFYLFLQQNCRFTSGLQLICYSAILIFIGGHNTKWIF